MECSMSKPNYWSLDYLKTIKNIPIIFGGELRLADALADYSWENSLQKVGLEIPHSYMLCLATL